MKCKLIFFFYIVENYLKLCDFKNRVDNILGMASIDSSAPETTSSDNSPTVVRRSTWLKQCGPGSDSGSSGESSDSFASSSSEEKAPRSKSREGERSVKINLCIFSKFKFFKTNL